MKKVLLSVLLAVSMTVSSFAADTKEIYAKAMQVFQADFKEAKNVVWTSKADYVQVSFTIESRAMDAFYDQEGDFIGTSHKIGLDEIPLKAKRGLAKKLAGYTVKEAIRFDTTDDTAYFVAAENETSQLYLKVSTFGLVSSFREIKK